MPPMLGFWPVFCPRWSQLSTLTIGGVHSAREHQLLADLFERPEAQQCRCDLTPFNCCFVEFVDTILSTQEYTLNCSATHMTHCAWPRNMGLFLSRALFRGAGEDRDVDINTYLHGFTLSSGVKCGANANLFLWGLSLCLHEVAVCPLQCREHRVLQKRFSS